LSSGDAKAMRAHVQQLAAAVGTTSDGLNAWLEAS